MKVLFISTMYDAPSGGSEELWSQTALRLVQEGNLEIGVAVKRWDSVPAHIQKLQDAGCSIYYIGGGRQLLYPSLLKRVLNKLLPAEKRYRVKKIEMRYFFLDEFRPDWAVLSQGDHNEGADFAEKLGSLHIPYVIINQLAKEGHWPTDGVRAAAVQNMFIRAERCFFTCRNNVAIVEKQIGVALTQAEIHINPFHVSYDQAVAYPPVDNGYHLACPAALTVIHKGQDVLFEVMSQAKWRERPLYINLYGKGPNEEQLRRLKEAWQLEKINFKGHVADMTSIWKENHGILLASKMEGVPVVLVGALLCGRMAVVTDVGGHRDFIDDARNGFLAKASTVELMDDALERAWQKRYDWEGMGREGTSKAKQIVPFDPVGMFAERMKKLFS